MPRRKTLAALLLVSVVAVAQPARADSIAVGVLTFDTFLLGPVGTNAFFISNLTGDPATGGFALPPDFPVATSLTFGSPMLSWIGSPGSPYGFGGVDIGPGNLDPAVQIQFPDTTPILSAMFSALLNTDVFHLTDGRFFKAVSPTIVATLTDPDAGMLIPGDFAFLTVDANEISAPSPVPEPVSLTLLASGLAVCAVWRRRKAAVNSTPI